MAEVTRRSVAVGGITLLAASEMETVAAKTQDRPTQTLENPEPTITFPNPITAMTELGVGGKLAVACGNDLYIIKVR